MLSVLKMNLIQVFVFGIEAGRGRVVNHDC
jgi:hypothetical protein